MFHDLGVRISITKIVHLLYFCAFSLTCTLNGDIVYLRGDEQMKGKRLWFSATPYTDNFLEKMEIETGYKAGENIQYLAYCGALVHLQDKAKIVTHSILDRAFLCSDTGKIADHLEDVDHSDLDKEDWCFYLETFAIFYNSVQIEFEKKVGIDRLYDWTGEKKSPFVDESILQAQRNGYKEIPERLKKLERIAFIAETKEIKIAAEKKLSGAQAVRRLILAFSYVEQDVYPEQILERAKKHSFMLNQNIVKRGYSEN